MSGVEPRAGHPNPTLQPPAGAVPTSPGVYRWRDATGRLLYVGKAKNLDKRIGSYFRSPAELHPRTRRMLGEARSLDWVVCATEAEALVLERNWISSEQPPFNVALRHGDGYVGVALTRDAVPRLFTWRGTPPRRATWFGPFPGVRSHDLVDALTHVFPVRSCNEATFKRHQQLQRGCLLAETGRCSAPCLSGANERHSGLIGDLSSFLSGRQRDVLDELELDMQRAANDQQFELAARRRDQLAGLRRVLPQQIAVAGCRDAVAVAVARTEQQGTQVLGIAVVTVLSGQIAGVQTRYTTLDPNAEDELIAPVLLALAAVPNIPRLVLAPELNGSQEALRAVLSDNAGQVTAVTRPRGDVERQLISFAQRNAENALTLASVTRRDDSDQLDAALAELGDALGSAGLPRRVECIDISHTQGSHPVASITVLVNGLTRPREYRRVNIPVDLGGNDPGSIAFAIERRLTGNRCGLTELPDLFLIDGGQMQVDAAFDAVAPIVAGSDYQPAFAGLAKRLEELWLPHDNDPVILPRASLALQLVQTVRDEAHRWAITGHRKQRDKAALKVRLDSIPGVGPARKRALLERFGNQDGIARASVDELSSTPGVGPDVARRIHAAYHSESADLVE